MLASRRAKRKRWSRWLASRPINSTAGRVPRARDRQRTRGTRDEKARVLDGRNRLAACEKAGIKRPVF
jgi:hypothetical protein